MPNDLSGVVDRTGFLGGSDAAAVLGLSPWKTPLALYLEKIGQAPPPDPGKAAFFARGKRWEPIARDMLLDALEDKYGTRPKLLKVNQRFCDSFEYPFLSCEIDAELEIDGEVVNAELKTVHAFKAKEWGVLGEDGELTDSIPVHYAAQAMHGLGVTGRRRCIVGALFGADSMVPYEIIRDDETVAAIKEKCIRFWVDHVLAQMPPDPVNMEDMLRLFARANGRPVEADAEAADLVGRLQVKRAERKSVETAIDGLEFQIADYVRKQWALDGSGESADDNAVLLADGHPILTWKKQSRAAYSVKASEFRVMRITTPRSK